ncbi:MAG: hypothetical protein O9275_19780 [Microcystis sp. LE19-196.1B]|jgi:hypothetical protein|nr:hypothetical protein [Microcystis sp. LE19-196.1B]
MESYAIKETHKMQFPKYYTGYRTKDEALKALENLSKQEGKNYSVVYVKEYPNQAIDQNGNLTSTVSEIPAPEK